MKDPLHSVLDYFFGKYICKIFGHKYDKEMLEKYNKNFCDRCYLIK